jgi:hypothetical protein
MKRFPGVLLVVILALVIAHIFTLRMLSSAQKRIDVLEKKVAALEAPAKPAPVPATQQPANSGK